MQRPTSFPRPVVVVQVLVEWPTFRTKRWMTSMYYILSETSSSRTSTCRVANISHQTVDDNYVLLQARCDDSAARGQQAMETLPSFRSTTEARAGKDEEPAARNSKPWTPNLLRWMPSTILQYHYQGSCRRKNRSIFGRNVSINGYFILSAGQERGKSKAAAIREEEMGEPTHDWILRPGDVMYLPRG